MTDGNAAPTGFLIHIVEDDDDDADILKSILLKDRRAAEVVRSTNGQEALAWLEQNGGRKPDLIICDLNMPVLDGHAFLTRVRMVRGFKGVPIAVLTSSAQASDYHRSLIRRADTFITKPDELRSLTSVMERLLDHVTWETKLPYLLAA